MNYVNVGLLALLLFSSGAVHTQFVGFSETKGAVYTPTSVFLTSCANNFISEQGSQSAKKGNIFGSTCETLSSQQGICLTFPECFPYWKPTDAINFEQTCFDEELKMFGVCCTKLYFTRPKFKNFGYDYSAVNTGNSEEYLDSDWSTLGNLFARKSSSCGVKEIDTEIESDQARIVGGHEAKPNEWPWLIILLLRGQLFCGASLISTKHALTAAHCVVYMTSTDLTHTIGRLRAYDLRSSDDTDPLDRRIVKLVMHGAFNLKTLMGDIAILTFEKPVIYSRTIKPICMPDPAKTYAGRGAEIAGWGALQEKGITPRILQETELKIWRNSDCSDRYGSVAPVGIIDSMLCASAPHRDSCSGDSGGPLMVKDEGHWVQVGIVSWGIGCNKGYYPGTYTRVSSFLNWIQVETKSNS